MIADSQTNFLYLADKLPVKYPKLTEALKQTLTVLKISYTFLPDTKDIWARDYMPIQIAEKKFIQFVYFPDYLKHSKKWRNTISDSHGISQKIGVEAIKTEIVLDGGNVVHCKDKVIMCNKVFKENPSLSEKYLRKRLEELFEVDRIIFIPQDPNDEIGHADGMVRFLSEDVVLINRYSNEDRDLGLNIKSALLNAGLDYIEVPFNPYNNNTDLDATGIYLNFLQIGSVILLPIFNHNEDDRAIRLFEDLYSGSKIVPIACSDLAKEGGILNCISWNILEE